MATLFFEAIGLSDLKHFSMKQRIPFCVMEKLISQGLSETLNYPIAIDPPSDEDREHEDISGWSPELKEALQKSIDYFTALIKQSLSNYSEYDYIIAKGFLSTTLQIKLVKYQDI